MRLEIYEFDSNRGGRWHRIREGLSDIVAGAALWSIWVRLGWRDFLKSTRRTALGPIWTIIATSITVGVLGYVYGSVLSASQADHYPYIAAGFILWFFIASTVGGGFETYIGFAGVLQERPLPISFTAFRYVFRFVIELLFRSFVFFGAVALSGFAMRPVAFLAVPGVVLFVLNGLWAVLLFGSIGTRFRDVQQFVNPLMFIAFLASPVLWRRSMLANENRFIADFNPFAHFLAVVREPLLGHPPPAVSLWIVLGVTVVGWTLAIWLFARTKNRIVYWL